MSWFKGLFSSIGSKIKNIFSSTKIDEGSIEKLEDIFIAADLGAELTKDLINIAKGLIKKNKEVNLEDLLEAIALRIEEIILPCEKSFAFDSKSLVVLVIGPNGCGKTTSIAKLAYKFKKTHDVTIIAGDTFRAAAAAQLTIWGDRLNVTVLSAHNRPPDESIHRERKRDDSSIEAYVIKEASEMDIGKRSNIDPAGFIYNALTETTTSCTIIDTAGRLHTNAALMAELGKISRTIKKLRTTHETIMVVDSTVGQNIHNQISVFNDICPISGLFITKLDGTAKGGSIVRFLKSHPIPIIGLGTGETIEAVEDFDAKKFARSVCGLI